MGYKWHNCICLSTWTDCELMYDSPVSLTIPANFLRVQEATLACKLRTRTPPFDLQDAKMIQSGSAVQKWFVSCHSQKLGMPVVHLHLFVFPTSRLFHKYSHFAPWYCENYSIYFNTDTPNEGLKTYVIVQHGHAVTYYSYIRTSGILIMKAR